MTDPIAEMREDDEEYGCHHCENDGPLNENNCCPYCDAWYPEVEQI